ncbi:MAG TPA: molybdopterin-dependent oxidoreductase [Microbacterium sp.]|nr:molybdopterin-dependent oxidoreductase [Microbacterium sp.]
MAVFGGRRRSDDPALPPGQHLTESFPVLSAGPTPVINTHDWEFFIHTEDRQTHRWNWTEFLELPAEDVSTDIHCVTSWSKLGTSWRGVSLDTLFAQVTTQLDYVMAHSFGGYTTNLPLTDILGGRAWIAYEYDGAPLDPEHGGPARLLVPHLYFWKSAKWVRGLVMQHDDKPGFWEENGYHLHGDPWREERYGAWREDPYG